jgi:hypothetical protein
MGERIGLSPEASTKQIESTGFTELFASLNVLEIM